MQSPADSHSQGILHAACHTLAVGAMGLSLLIDLAVPPSPLVLAW